MPPIAIRMTAGLNRTFDSSRAPTSRKIRSEIGYAMDVSLASGVADSCCRFGLIRKIHEMSPTPAVTTSASRTPARSRPVDDRGSSSIATISNGYMAR